MSTSFQTKYAGQQGWNDCQSEILNKKLANSSSTSINSTVSSNSVSAKRSLTPSSIAPPPRVDMMKSSSSVASFDSVSVQESLTELLPVVTFDEVKKVLDQVLVKPSSLSSKEFSHYKSRLQKTLNSLDESHLQAVNQACLMVLDKNDVVAAREHIVQHSLFHPGVSAWAVPLRRVIEGINV